MGLRSGLPHLGPPRRCVADLAAPIQLAPAAQQSKIKSAHQPPRSCRGQPVEAPHLAGIECDGATYHRSATARDRDRLRELVLTELGWKIRRIWSTEWWMDAGSALDKIHRQLKSDLEADRLERARCTLVS